MKINWIVRLRNPIFDVQLILAVFAPILAYAGIEYNDLTTWQALIGVLFAAAKNPYVLGLVIISLWHAINDPTTAGLSDSSLALKYNTPYKTKKS